jgi:type III secretory pathway component EscV
MIGVLLMVLGIAAERSGQPAFNFLALGAFLLILGFFLWRKLKPKARQNTRFSLFRKRGREDEAAQEIGDRDWKDKTYD